MENYGYERKSSESLFSQPLLWMKYFENEYSMLASLDRHTFALILVNWLTEKMNFESPRGFELHEFKSIYYLLLLLLFLLLLLMFSTSFLFMTKVFLIKGNSVEKWT